MISAAVIMEPENIPLSLSHNGLILVLLRSVDVDNS